MRDWISSVLTCTRTSKVFTIKKGEICHSSTLGATTPYSHIRLHSKWRTYLLLKSSDSNDFFHRFLNNWQKNLMKPPKAEQETKKKIKEPSEEDYRTLEIIPNHLPAVLFQFFHSPSPAWQILSGEHPLWILAPRPSGQQSATGTSGCTSLRLEAAHKKRTNFSRAVY